MASEETVVLENVPAVAAITTFPGGRLDGLDALRGIAMLCGVLLHATVAYLPTRMPHLTWPIFDDKVSPLCDVIFWGLHAFRLPTFFFLSGFFAEYLFQSRGPQKFLEHRIKRLAIPYGVGVCTILPLTFCVWTMGWLISGRCTLEQAITPFVPFEPELQAHVFSLGHLWFLYDLIIMSASFLILRQEWPTNQGLPAVQLDWLNGPIRTPILLAFPVSMILWGDPSPVIDFHNSILPNSSRMLYFSIFFTVGVAAFRRRDEFFQATRRPGVHLAISMTCIAVMFWFLPTQVSGEGSLLARMCFTWCVGLSAWFFIFGAMGVVVRSGQFHSPSLRYLADSSYWMYLVHLPIVGLSHIALHESGLAPELKMLLTFVISVAVGFGSYVVFVRGTIIGTYLHGQRTRRTEDSASAPVVVNSTSEFSKRHAA